MLPLEQYLSEALFAKPTEDILMRYNDTIDDPLVGTDVFTVGKETGNPLIDHLHGLVCSSLDDILIVLADFSAFDSSQKWENARKYMLAGYLEACKDLDWTGKKPFLGFNNFVEIAEHVIKSRKEVTFELEDGTHIKLDQLLSGEFATLVFNGVTNLANYHDLYDELRTSKNDDVLSLMRLFRLFIQGDDSVSFWETLEKFDIKVYQKFLHIFVSKSIQNGLDLNKLKTTTRFFFYEYLKKTFIYGRYVPLFMQTMPFSCETKNYAQDPISVMFSWCDVLRVMVYRGHNHELCNLMSHIGWLFHRNYKMQSFSDKDTKWYILPYAVYWLPIACKGVGQSTRGMIIPAKDGILAWEYINHKEWFKVMSDASHMGLEVRSAKSQIAQTLYDGIYTKPKDPFDEMKKFVKDNVMDDTKLYRSIDAVKKLHKGVLS